MTIDPSSVQGLLTAFAAVVAALVALWNAFQNAKITKKVDETTAELKALRHAQAGR